MHNKQSNNYNTNTYDIEQLLKHTTTLLAWSDHYILRRLWRFIVDEVQTTYHCRPMVL